MTSPPPASRRARRRAGALLIVAALASLAASCDRGGSAAGAAPTGTALDSALADSLARRLADAYDFSRPDVVQRLMALYPDTGPVLSAAAGRVTTSRLAVRLEVERFWQRVGQNMRDPRFVIEQRWGTRLGPDAAALTLEYRIPHTTPEGRPHTLSGAWTAVFQRRAGEWVVVQEHLSDVPAR